MGNVGQDIGSGGGAQSTRVALWDWAAGELEAQSAGPTEQLCGVGFNRYSDDPNAIFTYGMRKPPRFWSLEPDGFIKMEGVTKGVGSVIPPYQHLALLLDLRPRWPCHR